jgi:hypothetical protein
MADDLPAVVAKTLPVYAGDDRSFPITLKDSNEDPVDLTGYEFSAQWRPSRASDTAFDLIVEDTDLANGDIALTVTGETSASIVEDVLKDSINGVWDIQGVRDGVTVTFLTGTMKIKRDVTRG